MKIPKRTVSMYVVVVAAAAAAAAADAIIIVIVIRTFVASFRSLRVYDELESKISTKIPKKANARYGMYVCMYAVVAAAAVIIAGSVVLFERFVWVCWCVGVFGK